MEDGHLKMVSELASIHALATESDPYFQEASIEETQARISMLPADGEPVEFLHLQADLARDFRRIGKYELAVRQFQVAEEHALREDLHRNQDLWTSLQFELGLSWLRVGETENCVHCRTGESCILPIREGGIHQHQNGSRSAIEHFTNVLNLDSSHLAARWLLNIAYMTLGEYPREVPDEYLIPPSAFESSAEFPRFADVAAQVGVQTVNCCGGAIAEDFDQDGWIDILTSTYDPGGQIHFFRNSGEGRFADATADSGLAGILGGLNMIQGDYDNDGDVDVYVMRGAWLRNNGRVPNSLIANLGGGRFRDVTFETGLGDVHFPTSSAGWADYDLDGDLDLYVGNESSRGLAAPSQLFRNDGREGFTDVAASAGVENLRYAKGVVWGDYDGDRRPDLYVSNLDGPNRLYHNRGDGTFTDVAGNLGVTRPNVSFPAWFWDANNDGALDLFVGSYETGIHHVAADFLGLPRDDEPDCLYLGNADGRFIESAREFGLTRCTQPMGSNFGDLDNDGFPDFYLGTGYPGYEGLMPNLMFHNLAGRSFEDVTFAGGFGHLQKGHGVAFADLDNDGDLDVFNQMGGAYPGDAFGDVLFENPGFGNHWIRLKLIGSTSNRSAIGTRICVNLLEGGRRRSVYHWVNSGGSFGGNPLSPQIGLGSASRIEQLEVYWPASDITQRFNNVPTDRFLEIREDRTEYRELELRTHPFAAPDPDVAAAATDSDLE